MLKNEQAIDVMVTNGVRRAKWSRLQSVKLYLAGSSPVAHPKWKRGREADCRSLLNSRPLRGSVGSNPTVSAKCNTALVLLGRPTALQAVETGSIPVRGTNTPFDFW